MIIATTDYVPGKQVKEYIGFVQGNTVQSKHIGKDIMAGLKTIVGGEIKAYTEMMEEARSIAIDAWSTRRNDKEPMRWSAQESRQRQLWRIRRKFWHTVRRSSWNSKKGLTTIFTVI